jgi:tetratricopeptide (TPR) repeat protein
MTGHKLTDAIPTDDAQTMRWKTRFSAAKGAYKLGEFRQCESLLYRATEEAKALKESTFATNACYVGLGAVYLATGKTDQAREQLENAINALSGSSSPALTELSAVARRFYAEVLTATGDEAGAEHQLHVAVHTLEQLGADYEVPLGYALSDLAALYVTQGKLQEAKELLFSAMKLLERGLGGDNPEYIQANLIYNICSPHEEEEMLSEVKDGIFKMQYQLGSNHPSLTRALRWYVKKRLQRGETDKIAEIQERFDTHFLTQSA